MLPSLSLTYKELEIIKKSFFEYGSEGHIVRSSKNSVYKIFSSSLPDAVIMNKSIKMQKLYKIKNFDNGVKILTKLTCNDKVVGYEMSYNEKDLTLSDLYLGRREKITYLKKLKKKLLYFESLGILYTDLRCDNILVNPETEVLSLCDLDNITLGNHPTDCLPVPVQIYNIKHGSIDKKIHPFMHNLLTLSMLEYEDTTLTKELEKVENGNYFDNLSLKSQKTIKELTKLKSYQGSYLIDTLK